MPSDSSSPTHSPRSPKKSPRMKTREQRGQLQVEVAAAPASAERRLQGLQRWAIGALKSSWKRESPVLLAGRNVSLWPNGSPPGSAQQPGSAQPPGSSQRGALASGSASPGNACRSPAAASPEAPHEAQTRGSATAAALVAEVAMKDATATQRTHMLSSGSTSTEGTPGEMEAGEQVGVPTALEASPSFMPAAQVTRAPASLERAGSARSVQRTKPFWEIAEEKKLRRMTSESQAGAPMDATGGVAEAAAASTQAATEQPGAAAVATRPVDDSPTLPIAGDARGSLNEELPLEGKARPVARKSHRRNQRGWLGLLRRPAAKEGGNSQAGAVYINHHHP